MLNYVGVGDAWAEHLDTAAEEREKGNQLHGGHLLQRSAQNV